MTAANDQVSAAKIAQWKGRLLAAKSMEEFRAVLETVGAEIADILARQRMTETK